MSEREFVDFFVKTGKEIHYKKNGIIIRPEDPPTGVYLVKKGYIRIYSITQDGTIKIHILYKPGDVFPLTWALINEQKKLYYEAMNDTVLYRMKKDKFLDVIRFTHNFTLILLKMITVDFSVFSDRVDDLEISKTYPRIVSCLLFLAKHYGQSLQPKEGCTADSCLIEAPVTQQDVANFSSMTRETASREISVLEKKKIISYKDHLIVINSLKKLNNEMAKE